MSLGENINKRFSEMDLSIASLEDKIDGLRHKVDLIYYETSSIRKLVEASQVSSQKEKQRILSRPMDIPPSLVPRRAHTKGTLDEYLSQLLDETLFEREKDTIEDAELEAALQESRELDKNKASSSKNAQKQ